MIYGFALGDVKHVIKAADEKRITRPDCWSKALHNLIPPFRMKTVAASGW